MKTLEFLIIKAMDQFQTRIEVIGPRAFAQDAEMDGTLYADVAEEIVWGLLARYQVEEERVAAFKYLMDEILMLVDDKMEEEGA